MGVEKVGRAALVGKVGKAVERRFTVADLDGRLCENCGAALKKPLKGPWPRFCSDRCRKAKSRGKS